MWTGDYMAWGSISLFGGFLENENSLETMIVIFENVSPKVRCDWKWSISKFLFWQRILDIYRQPLLRSDDGDDNENVKKARGLITKTILHAHYAFLYISLPSLQHDYNVKMPIFTFYSGITQATKFPLSFWTWIWFLGIQLLGGFTFDKVSVFE